MTKTITLNHITKIEGHAHLTLNIDKGKLAKCELGSIEGSRYFEGMLKGRDYKSAAWMASRICGICSSAHTLAATQAVENALKIKISKQSILLREMIAWGERIRSHATHLYFLALPDYLGYESALAMTKDYKSEIQMALRLMKTGNHIIQTVGGRDLHPVSVCVGGMRKSPTKEQISEIKKMVLEIKPDAIATAKLFSKLKNKKFETKGQFFSLYNGKTYATQMGDLKSGKKTYKQRSLHKFIKEYHEQYSTANFVVKQKRSYLVGALARLNNNYKLLSRDAKKALRESGMKIPNKNVYLNNLAQAIEIIHFADRITQICDELEKIKPEQPVKYEVRPGHGIAATEAPRGILWHEYKINEDGEIIFANIVTPTCQYLRNLQDDIKLLVESMLNESKEKIVAEVEKLIRSYDPCFSCSTHFLEVKWE